MTDLTQRQKKIQERKKQNSFRDFLLEIVSWYPLVLYKNQGLISLYPDNERSCPVISHQEFETTRESLLEKGIDYDMSKSFFENMQKLFRSVPFSSLYNYPGAENSSFAFSVMDSKDCYLAFTVITDCENIAYSFAVKEGCRNVFNSVQVSDHSENVHQCSCVIKGYNIYYSKFIDNSANIWFCANMIGCQECLFCDGLENRSYCIGNKQYDQEEYVQRKQSLLAQKDQFDGWYGQLQQQGTNYGSHGLIDANFVLKSEDVRQGQFCFGLKDAQNVLVVGSPHPNEHMYDAFEAGSLGNSHFYGAMNAGVNSEHVYNCEGVVTCYNVYYCRFVENCKYCLGCIGLQNKEYCILNKQYEKEEWFDLVDRIFSSFDGSSQTHPNPPLTGREGTLDRLGSFFPAWLNPFYFNDTIAHLVGDFSKKEVLDAGYLWREEAIKVDIPEGVEVVDKQGLYEYESWQMGDEGDVASSKSPLTPLSQEVKDASDTPNSSGIVGGSWYIDPSILDKVISDVYGDYYRIVPMERDFLIKHKLPLPRKHWLERLKMNF